MRLLLPLLVCLSTLGQPLPPVPAAVVKPAGTNTVHATWAWDNAEGVPVTLTVYSNAVAVKSGVSSNGVLTVSNLSPGLAYTATAQAVGSTELVWWYQTNYATVMYAGNVLGPWAPLTNGYFVNPPGQGYLGWAFSNNFLTYKD